MLSKIAGACAAIVLVGLYGFSIARGVMDLIELPQMAYENMGLSLTFTGAFWLWVSILLPAIVFAIALVLTRERRASIRFLALFAGLAVTALYQLELAHLIPRAPFFA